ncbi:MAG: acyl-CoA dehydrogenase family protein [Haloarculaceae archaeon]
MIPHHDSDRALEVTERVREFIDEEVLPVERALPPGEEVPEDIVADLRAEARERGIYAPQMPEDLGGLGLDLRDALPVYEQSGRSYLAQPALRVDAPDEGTMHLLERLATEDQREEYLRPLVDAEISSAFAMTEPMQGGGADPTMVKTRAERDGDEWVIDGHKWWITNGSEAAFFVVMARTDPDVHPYEGSSMFIVPADTPGIEVVRDLPHLGESTLGTVHSEVLFEDVRVPEENLLGEAGQGFAHAQKRMVPARLTQCMRHSGKARRALDVAEAFMSEREVFGDTVAEKQAPRFDIADAETRLRAARLLARDAARAHAAGSDARVEASMAKYFTTNVSQGVVDTALQVCGANGIGMDLPLSQLFADARIIRIADGPDEVQKRVIARDAFENVDEREVEHLSRFGDPRRP